MSDTLCTMLYLNPVFLNLVLSCDLTKYLNHRPVCYAAHLAKTIKNRPLTRKNYLKDKIVKSSNTVKIHRF